VAENVARLNEALVNLASGAKEFTRHPLFATGLYLRVAPNQRALTISSFGHLGPIFSKSGRIEPKDGLPVGILTSAAAGPWSEQILPFERHGRRLLLHTDGLTEQFDPSGEMYGEARLEQHFIRNLHLPLQSLVDAIRGEVEAFRGDALIKDDQALLAIEVAEG
jgi:serine phosphatase RsbU (regulator of sigma subunit)